MIVRAATCPHPPLLLPGATGLPVREVSELRAACRTAVDDLVAAAPDVLVAVGSAPGTRTWPADAASPVSLFAPALGSAPEGDLLPLSLAVARDLTETVPVPVEFHGIDAAAPVELCRGHGRWLAGRPERIGLLVMADGSARRGPKAPGHEDARALELDHLLGEALHVGDPGPFLDLAPDVAAELLVEGRVAWQVLAGACEGRAVDAKCRYSDDPFGVWYPVFTWTLE
ncbi:hypothetical protein [Amycolatopsis sp. RTGN1]|uniref:hypothetical protein n=1 Tax=Amycolatopsis ponsaeliensis TaxID=2992142 RepID=UPI00254BCE0D|nr:hypothetical protein [Amycolatopsis sp. RTGN1]